MVDPAGGQIPVETWESVKPFCWLTQTPCTARIPDACVCAQMPPEPLRPAPPGAIGEVQVHGPSGNVLSRTWHMTQASMDVEIAVAVSRRQRGEVGRIQVYHWRSV